MDAIYNNSNNINLLNFNDSKDINLINNKSQITNENSNSNSTNTKTDSIEISEKDENKINKLKASNAFKESSLEFYKETGSKMGVKYQMIAAIMKINSNIDVPSFNINDNSNGNNTSFLKFIDQMEDYVGKNNIIDDKTGTSIDKKEFLDFCDLYKEKLIKYDCK